MECDWEAVSPYFTPIQVGSLNCRVPKTAEAQPRDCGAKVSKTFFIEAAVLDSVVDLD